MAAQDLPDILLSMAPRDQPHLCVCWLPIQPSLPQIPPFCPGSATVRGAEDLHDYVSCSRKLATLDT